MKKTIAALVALLGVPAGVLQAQTVGDFDDIQFWTGTGTNRAALVLQWNDGGTPASLVWGYRWNGEATGAEMLLAIAGESLIRDLAGDPVETLEGADPRLTLGLVRYNFGDAVESIVFDAPPTVRTREDWLAGYWEYFVFGGTFEYFDFVSSTMETYSEHGSPVYANVAWLSAPVGPSDRPLVDGSWDAFSFAPGFDSQPVQPPVAASLPVPALGFAMVSGVPTVSFDTVAGLSYRVQFNDSLSGEWGNLGGVLAGTGGPLLVTDTASPLPGARFYRVLVWP